MLRKEHDIKYLKDKDDSRQISNAETNITSLHNTQGLLVR